MIVNRLSALKPNGDRFVIKTGEHLLHWTTSNNKKIMKYINSTTTDAGRIEHDYHEFVLGGFGDQHLINVLMRHDKTVTIEQARWNFIKNVVYEAICNTAGKFFMGNSLVEHANSEFPVIIYCEDWDKKCNGIHRLVAEDSRFTEFSIYYYVAIHGLKNKDLETTSILVNQSLVLNSPYIMMIIPNLTVMLDSNKVREILLGNQITYFHPLLLRKICHFGNADGVRGGPLNMTNLMVYDQAAHIMKTSVQGSQAILAILGNLKYCHNKKLKSMKFALQSYERYLLLRAEIPHQLRIEGVFSFSDWSEVVDSSWPADPDRTHGMMVEKFLNSGSIVLIGKSTFKNHMEVHCIRYMNLLKKASYNAEKALPRTVSIQRVFDIETIVRYVMHGTTEQLCYARMKHMLVKNTVGESVDAN